MKKPWSYSTTVRNPERIRSFLGVLASMEGDKWNRNTQRDFQIRLIQNKLYGYGSVQFTNDLPEEYARLMEDDNTISFEEAEKILKIKNYAENGEMRGRTSFKPIQRMGFVSIDENDEINISKLGEYFLSDDYDLGETFFRSLLKWQLPNPMTRGFSAENGYNIKPFVGTLHLINEVNKLEERRGNKAKGLQKKEFSVFALVLIDYHKIEGYAQKIIELRDRQKGKPKAEKKNIFEDYVRNFLSEFADTDDGEKLKKLRNNLDDYGDNVIRYFRLTRFLHIRGGGYYIDLEPRRKIEINNLLKDDDASVKEFESERMYVEYISDIDRPTLPWEQKTELIKIIEQLIYEIESYEEALGITAKSEFEYQSLSDNKLKDLIKRLRLRRRDLQEEETRKESQKTEKIEEYIEALENIYSFEEKPIALEKYVSLGLKALNDAIEVRPNYPVGDDNEPTFTAPANTPDIECFYNSFDAICEVTMLKSRDQWYNEGQPVMRHMREFEKKSDKEKVYCVFVAPKLHRDTINTFWLSAKYEYEGKPQKIVPLRLDMFTELLQILLDMKECGVELRHEQLTDLYNKISDTSSLDSAEEWLDEVPENIKWWKNKMLS
jgi:hypothetical protein